MALSPAGKLLWERSLSEEVGFLTTHGGRIGSPTIYKGTVIISGVTFSWGAHGRGQHRFMAFDLKTGQFVWATNFAGRPYDTTYAAPYITKSSSGDLLIQGGSDGVVYALRPATGELAWKYEISKRGINTGVVVKDGVALLTHSEENLASSEMGMLAAVDVNAKGELKNENAKWNVLGWQGGFSSPVLDGDRFYQVDNGANLAAFDAKSGKQLWLQNLGTIQKASLVLADGKLYVGTENGKFFILKPSATGCEILDSDQLGTEKIPEGILASVAVANGRVFLISDTSVYCIGQKGKREAVKKERIFGDPATPGPPASLLVTPSEITLKPGESVPLKITVLDAEGQPLSFGDKAQWAVSGFEGTVSPDGVLQAAATNAAQVGEAKATVKGVTGAARVRVIPPLPYSENFDAMTPNSVPMFWTNAQLKYAVRDVNGQRVLVKTTEGSSLLTRARAYFGLADWHDYTVEADVQATERRRSIGDAGVIAQRYMLMLYGNAQKLEITPWQPETNRAATIPFAWEKNKWYRLKLRVENLPGGKVRARGKVWPVGEAEPAGWLIEKIDPIGNRTGSPGIFGNALAEVFFDNLKVTPN
jgi:outer membrane protein assembly factor BamB